MLHLTYDDPTFLHSRDPASYDMSMAMEMKPSSFMSEQYMLGHLLHPLEPLSTSHSMPYDTHNTYAPSQYHMNPIPYDLHQGNDMHHPIPIRPIHPNEVWPHQLPDQTDYVEQHPPTFPPSSISQPSMFVQPTSDSRASKIALQVVDSTGPPPAPWTMSGSLDPSTGVYQIASEHPRIRTAQACEKCRGRKAKCSGEHPICERCRSRGLKCEYAPERKMRGPNKLKRKTATNDADLSRRMSIASSCSLSSVSSNSEDTSDSSRKSSSSFSPSDSTGPKQFTMRFDVTPSLSNATSTSSPQSPSPSLADAQPESLHKHRPSHIDLAGTKFDDQMLPPSFVPETPPFQFENFDTSPSGSNVWRRASLPSYLLEAFTTQLITSRSPSLGSVYTPPRGLSVVDATVTRPRSNPSYTHDVSSVFPPSTMGSSGGNSSGLSVSTPLTPLTNPPDMIYSLDFHESLDFSNFDAHLNDSADRWAAVAPTEAEMDVDVTPRVTTDGCEKSLAQLESELFQD